VGVSITVFSNGVSRFFQMVCFIFFSNGFANQYQTDKLDADSFKSDQMTDFGGEFHRFFKWISLTY
jgi:hypothetical protein